ncbi:MAG: prepilin peptidase [Candidatus Margulisiibacteriota bacterium]
MIDLMSILDVFLLTLVCMAVYLDHKTRKIPNVLTINGILAGIVLNIGLHLYADFSLLGLGQGVFICFGGLLLAVLIGLIPFSMGGLGGGDVKLLAMIGAFKGPQFILWTMLFTAVAGGVMAIFIIINKALSERKGITSLVASLKKYHENIMSGVLLPKSEAMKEKIPYSFAILAGVVFAYLFLQK